MSHIFKSQKISDRIGVPQQQGNGKSTRKNYNVACTWIDGEYMMMYLTLCNA